MRVHEPTDFGQIIPFKNTAYLVHKLPSGRLSPAFSCFSANIAVIGMLASIS